MSNNKIIVLNSFLFLNIIVFGQANNNTGKFIFSGPYNRSTLELNNNHTCTLTATACTSNCKQSGNRATSSDTIKLQSPLTTQGGDECLLYHEVYSVLILKDNKLFLVNTD